MTDSTFSALAMLAALTAVALALAAWLGMLFALGCILGGAGGILGSSVVACLMEDAYDDRTPAREGQR